MPSNKKLDDLRKFIEKYYEDKTLLRIYDNSVFYNRHFFINLQQKKYKLI